MRLFVALLALFAASAMATTVVYCPVDCNLNNNITQQLDACLAQRPPTLCTLFVDIIPQDQFLALLGVPIDNVTDSEPVNFIYQPTGDLVDRVVCPPPVNTTGPNGTVAYVCIERCFYFVDTNTTVNVALSGTCLSTLFSFPGVAILNFTGHPLPATINGGNFPTQNIPTQPNTLFQNIIFDGSDTTDPFFADCRQNGNFTFVNCSFVRWGGDYILNVESCAYDTSVVLKNLYFQDVRGTAMWFKGQNNLQVDNVICSRCGQINNSNCLRVFMSPAAVGKLDIDNVDCWRVQNLMPPRCRYCLGIGDSGFCGVRCNEGLIQVYSPLATAALGSCDEQTVSFVSYSTLATLTLPDFERICRIYEAPQCNPITVASMLNNTNQKQFTGGDILWTDQNNAVYYNFDMPLYCQPGGGTVVGAPWTEIAFTNSFGYPIFPPDLPPLPPPPVFTNPSFEQYNYGNWDPLQIPSSNPPFIWPSLAALKAKFRFWVNALPMLTIELLGGWGAIPQGELSAIDPSEIGRYAQPQDFRVIDGTSILFKIASNRPALTGAGAFLCTPGLTRTMQQVITFPVTGPYSLSFYMLRNAGTQGQVADIVMDVLIDGVVVSSIGSPTWSSTLTDNGVYFLINFPGWVTTAGTHLFALRLAFAPNNKVEDEKNNYLNTIVRVDHLMPVGFPIDNPEFEVVPFGWTGMTNSFNMVPVWPVFNIANCGARTGDYRMVCRHDSGMGTWIEQSVTIPFKGSYQVSVYMQRRQSVSNFDGTFIQLYVNGVPSPSVTSITGAILPTQDTWYQVNLAGTVVAPADMTVVSVRIACQLNGVNTETTICMDDFAFTAVGTQGVPAFTLGFQSGIVSEAPTIPNTTCYCDTNSVEPRDPLLLPCVYQINPSTICIEGAPTCCTAQYLNAQPLTDSVFVAPGYPAVACQTLGSVECLYFVNCIFDSQTNQVSGCTQYLCPLQTNASYIEPLLSQVDTVYFVRFCEARSPFVLNDTLTANTTFWTNITWDNITGQVFYWPTTIFESQATYLVVPASYLYAYFVDCALANNSECFIYTNCNLPEVNLTAPFQFQITGCDLLWCDSNTSTLGTSLSPLTDFTTCAVNATGVTLYDISGGWGLVPFINIGTLAQIFGRQTFLRYFVTWFIELQQTPFVGTPFINASLVPNCAPFALFRTCTCNNSVGQYDVPYQIPPSDPTFNEPQGPPQYYTCTSGSPSCLCNTAALDVSNAPPLNSVGILIENAPDSLQRFRMINNRLQQYGVGISVMQVTYSLVANSSIVAPTRDDLRGIVRLIGQNDNEFINCTIPYLQGSVGSMYSQICMLEPQPAGPSLPCPITWTTERQADCIVDDRATSDLPGYGATIFSVIQDAIDKPSCIVILVRANDVSSYYEEALLFKDINKKLVMYSLDGAVIVGEHEINTGADNMTFIGITFIHPQSNQKPLFDIVRNPEDKKDKNVNQLTFQNCEFRGGGCRKCGIFETKRLNNLNISYSRITSWDFFVLKLRDADNFYFSNNVVDETSGRVLLVKYGQSFYIDQNLFYNCRGQKSISGSVIISLTATEKTACDVTVPGRFCILRQNIQQVPNITRLTPLYKDGCFFLSGGQIQANQVYDNACVIAQTGITFVKLPNIGPSQLTYVMGLNPLIKPSLMQHREDKQFKKFWGNDFVLRSTTSSAFSNGGASFFFSNTIETDFDEEPFFVTSSPPICQANNNYDQRYGFQFGPGLGWPRMGYQYFSNASIGIAACTDRSWFYSVMNSSLYLPGYTLYVTPHNGSRVSPSTLNFQRNGQIVGASGNACCQGPDWRPAIMNVGHQLQAAYYNYTNLEWAMPWVPGPFNMFNGRPTDYTAEEITLNPEPLGLIIPAETIITDCIFNGRNIIPGQQGYVWDSLIGQPLPPKFFKAKTTKIPPYTQSMAWVIDSVIYNFPAFSDTETSNDGANYVSVGWPYFGGFRFQATNRINTNTNVTFNNLTATNMDFDAIEVFFVNNQTIVFTKMYNCSGRAYGNRQCIQLVGNDLQALLLNSRRVNATALFLNSPSQLQVLNITAAKTAETLYRYDNAASNPGFVTFLVLNGWPTTSNMCVIGGDVFGLPAALRYEFTENTTIIKCNELPFYIAPTFPDRARFLRAVCIPANLTHWRGDVHDLGFGAPTTDTQGNTIWCDSSVEDQCCPLVDPTQCYVTKNEFLLNASNPWLDRFMFATICDAIQFCQAPAPRVITVIGSADPFGTGDTSPKTYEEVINCQVPFMWPVSNATGPIIIQATANVTLESSGNRIDTQCIRTVFAGFTFKNPGLNPSFSGAPLWDQSTGPTMCNLSFSGNVWKTIYNWPHIVGQLGTDFTLNSNIFKGRFSGTTNFPPDTDPRNAVNVWGNCSQFNITIVNNRFEQFLGNGLYLQNVSQYYVRNNVFKQVGGMDTTYPVPDTSAIFVSDCPAPSLGYLPTTFKNNRVDTTQTAVAVVGKMAACWIDYVSRNIKPYKITRNICTGMDFGLRLNNLKPYNPPSNDPKRILREFAINYANIKCVGNNNVGPLNKRFDIVASNQYQDNQMVTTPKTSFYNRLWCTNGCPQSPWILIGIFIAVVGLLALICLLACLITSCCTPSHYRERYRLWKSNSAAQTMRLNMPNVLAEGPDVTRQMARITAEIAARKKAAQAHPVVQRIQATITRLITPDAAVAYRPLSPPRDSRSSMTIAPSQLHLSGFEDQPAQTEEPRGYADNQPLLPTTFNDEDGQF